MLKGFYISYFYLPPPPKYDPLITSWSGISPGHGSEIKTSQSQIINCLQTDDLSSNTLSRRTGNTELCWRWEKLESLHCSCPLVLKQTPSLHFKLAFRARIPQSCRGTLLSQLKGQLLRKRFKIPKKHSSFYLFLFFPPKNTLQKKKQRTKFDRPEHRLHYAFSDIHAKLSSLVLMKIQSQPWGHWLKDQVFTSRSNKYLQKCLWISHKKKKIYIHE